ncbi:transcription factor bHLH18-like isoform X1 [Herrania umbratica]|uniref:Transcription factor bHLH18-like isoform X1 n=2 Tax=Herrania umbratica TaxID=108875 RepID=A0A6J0ZG66_9ROSI|nr:transcription factor bHLH18-like isoform X1 [Herrania umbratica]
MEISSGKWLSELEMEDSTFLPQYQMMNPMDYSFDDLNFQSFSSESYSSYQNIDQKISSHNNMNDSCIGASHQVDDFQRPMKQLKTNSPNSCITENIPPKASSSPSSHIISFDNWNSSPAISQQYYGLDCAVKPKNEVGYDGNCIEFPSNLIPQNAYKDQYCSPKYGQASKRVGSLTRTPLHAQDHVIAERKRREKLSQRFISLSALIPGLKKTDKASVLGDAIKYLKQLQERVTTLEGQVAKKTMESVIFVKKTQIFADDETSSSDENFDSHSNKPLPEIEARVADKDVLIRIHCEKNKGCIPNIINEVEKLHLSVLNTNVLPFGQATQDITIVVQMEAEFSMTMKDLVKSLRTALLKFM